ncbi:hypothetical protein [Oceanidesulfovibrio marinus]|uniref:Uncharacterized protein n=1 Tax=Oceanidesulfovibrio marinus TaxID=370038 RepID=A0ABX6NID4_9BACT|nr:hypothetical protein [Oceanidesulfovibrio marinus]QJT10395.1 hypothetical protein E8L03_16295 [Oceanidesulfovibrio marinus]
MAMETALGLIWDALPYLPPAAARFVLQNADKFKDGLDFAGGFMPGFSEGLGGIPAFVKEVIFRLNNSSEE